jgi:hypothetical protein
MKELETQEGLQRDHFPLGKLSLDLKTKKESES